MSVAVTALLTFVALLACSIWVGGFVAIVVVARVARAQLDRPAQIAFFRALGRRYLVVGLSSLVVALAAGVALLTQRDWDTTALAAVIVAAALVVVTLAGVAQARGMTRARAREMRAPQDAELARRVQRGAARAVALRASIGGLTLAQLALAAVLAS
jgi:putative copper export protein